MAFTSTVLEKIGQQSESRAFRITPAEAHQRLSNRQRDVLGLLSYGLSNKEIASRLFITEPTVKAHISAVMRFFGCTNRTQVALIGFALREGVDIKIG